MGAVFAIVTAYEKRKILPIIGLLMIAAAALGLAASTNFGSASGTSAAAKAPSPSANYPTPKRFAKSHDSTITHDGILVHDSGYDEPITCSASHRVIAYRFLSIR